MWKRFIEWLRNIFSKRGGAAAMDQNTINLSQEQWEPLKKVLSEHKKHLATIEKAQQMYDGEFSILNKEPKRADDPNHKIVMNYSKLIVNMKANYMLGKPVTYNIPLQEDVSEEKILEFQKELQRVMEDNDDHAVDFLTVKKALIGGVGVVLFYFDDMQEIRYNTYTLNECIPILDRNKEIKQVIHTYIDDLGVECVEVWDSQAVTYLVKEEEDIKMDSRVKENPSMHYMPFVPASVFVNGEYAKPRKTSFAIGPSEISDDVQSMLEKLSDLISNNHNRLDIFCDPYLVFKNANVNSEDVLKMRAARAINVETNDRKNGEADVSYLMADLSIDSIEWQVSKLIDGIFETTDTPKIHKQEAISNLSGVAIKQLYTPLDNAVNEKEIYLNKYIRRKLIILTTMLNIKKLIAAGKDPISFLSSAPENADIYDFHWVDWENNRNIPQNEKEFIETIMLLKGTLSEETILSKIPYVEDVKEEIRKIEEEALKDPVLPLQNEAAEEEDIEEEEEEEVEE